jgi:hypothetical protein
MNLSYHELKVWSGKDKKLGVDAAAKAPFIRQSNPVLTAKEDGQG